MNKIESLYSKFECNSKEELYMLIKEKDERVEPLINYMEFSKGNIGNKNGKLTSPQDVIRYMNFITPPPKNKVNLVFVDTKNQPLLIEKVDIKNKENIISSIKKSVVAGSNASFIGVDDFSLDKEIDNLEETLNEVGIRIVDTLHYNNIDNTYYSQKAKITIRDFDEIRDIHHSDKNEKELINTYEYEEFANYYARKKIEGHNIVKDINVIKDAMKIGYQHSKQEVFTFIAYNKENNIIKVEELSRGGINASIVDPRIFLRELVTIDGLKGVALFHNHPSGNPEPSKEDLEVTKRLINVLENFNIEYFDHFIVGLENVVSLAEKYGFESKNFEYYNQINNSFNVDMKVLEDEIDFMSNINNPNSLDFLRTTSNRARKHESDIEMAKKLIKNFLIKEYGHKEGDINFNDISHIPIAHTQTEDGEHGIDIVVDLENYSINKHLDGTVVESITSENIHELISKELTTLDFSDLVYLDDKTIEKFKEKSKEYNLNTPIGKIPFTKNESEYYNKLTDFELMKLYIKERKENNFINPHTFEVMASRNLIFKGEKIEDIEWRLNSMAEIKKGDYIKTGASDNTLVLKVKDNDAILFTGNQFIVAHGIQKDGDRAYWAYGDYYNELPGDVFDKSKIIEDKLKEEIINLVDRAYNKIDKALTDDSKEYTEYRIAQGLDDILEIKRILEEEEIILEDNWELEP